MDQAAGPDLVLGSTILPLHNGTASFVIYRNGTAGIAAWSHGATVPPDVDEASPRVAFPASRELAVRRPSDRHHVLSMLTIGISSRDQRPCRMDTPTGIIQDVGRPARRR